MNATCPLVDKTTVSVTSRLLFWSTKSMVTVFPPPVLAMAMAGERYLFGSQKRLKLPFSAMLKR